MSAGDLSTSDWELLDFNQSYNESWPAAEPGFPFLYAIPAVYGLIILVGLVGNVTLIKIFCTVKSMRNVPNIFITSLALGDLLLLLTCAPVDASKYISAEWLFGRVGCKLIAFIQLTSVGVSVFTLTALSADRLVPANLISSLPLLFPLRVWFESGASQRVICPRRSRFL